MERLRTFRTICDICLNDVPGELRREGESVYHHKLCPEHGERRWLISRNGDLYARFDRHYHTLFPLGEKPPEAVDTYFFVTNSCNQGCHYCAAEANRYEYFEDFELGEFRKRLVSSPGVKASLVGGEPAHHPRFFEFVEAIAEAGKGVVVFTNGLAFSDETMVKRLMSASRGRCQVRLTFEGFDGESYDHLAGKNLVDKKSRALFNFRKYSVPITLGHTIESAEQADKEKARAVMHSLIEFGMKEGFVRGMTFRSLAAIGGMRHLRPEEVMSVDEVMDEVVAASPVPIPRRDAYLSQRMIQIIARIFGLPCCEYLQTALLFRQGKKWVGLDYFFDCDRLETKLDARVGRWPDTRTGLAAVFFLALLTCARLMRIPALVRLGFQVLPLFTGRYDFTSIPGSILPLNASTVCDRHNLDSNVARRCEKAVYSQVAGGILVETTSEMVIRHLRERSQWRAPEDEDREKRAASRRIEPMPPG